MTRRAVSRKGCPGADAADARDRSAASACENVFDPMGERTGLERFYLKWLLDRFDGDLRLALAGYNAGENEVGACRVPDSADQGNTRLRAEGFWQS